MAASSVARRHAQSEASRILAARLLATPPLRRWWSSEGGYLWGLPVSAHELQSVWHRRTDRATVMVAYTAQGWAAIVADPSGRIEHWITPAYLGSGRIGTCTPEGLAWCQRAAEKAAAELARRAGKAVA